MEFSKLASFSRPTFDLQFLLSIGPLLEVAYIYFSKQLSVCAYLNEDPHILVGGWWRHVLPKEGVVSTTHFVVCVAPLYSCVGCMGIGGITRMLEGGQGSSFRMCAGG